MAATIGIVGITITLPLPAECSVDTVYKVDGSAKLLKVFGVPPWVYLEVKRKAQYEPEGTEAWFASYERGLPVPISGNFSIDWSPSREGEYQVRAIATPAPLSLPVVGVPPIVGSSDVMPVIVTKPEIIPPIPPTPPELNLNDLIIAQIALDIRSFLIMLYRLNRAREVRLFNYLAIGDGDTVTYTYTVPSEYVYVPHIEEVNLGLQRVLTRYDYEGGNLLHTETYAIDRTIEWTMTPLSRIVEGSFGISFYNGGTIDTWVNSRFLGSIMRQSDYLLWSNKIRDLSKYLGFTT